MALAVLGMKKPQLHETRWKNKFFNFSDFVTNIKADNIIRCLGFQTA